MPQAPDASFAPDVDIDDSQKYILKLSEIEEQPSRFRDKNKNAMMLIHKWLVYGEDGVAIIDNSTGEVFELWQFTGDATYDNPQSGKIAPAREVANALIGHRLSDDEVRDMIAAGWEQSLAGKSCLADLEWYSDQNNNQKLRVLRQRPLPKKERAAAAPSSRGRRMLEDDD